MSLDLVSKSLDLEAQLQQSDSQTGKKKKNNSKNAMDLIKSDRQGVWKELRKVKKKQQKEVFEKRKRQPFKSAIEKYLEENTSDNTDRNVEALLKATELGKVKSDAAQKILYHQPNRLSKNIIEKPSSKEESSVFTEEDFTKFAKEYNP